MDSHNQDWQDLFDLMFQIKRTREKEFKLFKKAVRQFVDDDTYNLISNQFNKLVNVHRHVTKENPKAAYEKVKSQLPKRKIIVKLGDLSIEFPNETSIDLTEQLSSYLEKHVSLQETEDFLIEHKYSSIEMKVEDEDYNFMFPLLKSRSFKLTSPIRNEYFVLKPDKRGLYCNLYTHKKKT